MYGVHERQRGVVFKANSLRWPQVLRLRRLHVTSLIIECMKWRVGVEFKSLS